MDTLTHHERLALSTILRPSAELPIARPPAPAPPPARVTVTWVARTRPGELVAVGPQARTVLQVRAQRDIRIGTVRLDWPAYPEGLIAEVLVVYQEPCRGPRLCPVEGVESRRVKAVQDFPLPPRSFGAPLVTPEKPIVAPPRTDLPGRPDNLWWNYGGWSDPRFALGKGQAVGVIVRTNLPALCQCLIGGQ